VPQSAIVTGFPDGIVERNRDAYLLSPATLLDRVARPAGQSSPHLPHRQVREQEAVVRSSAGRRRGAGNPRWHRGAALYRNPRGDRL
jgi:hypothetical protein